MLLKNDAARIDYFEDWPNCYYEISDPQKRKVVLQEAIEKRLDISGDRYREKIYNLRYDSRNRADLFMHAWMMMNIAATNSGIHFLNRKSKGKEYRNFMSQLLICDFHPENETEHKVLMEEWRSFARFYIASCVSSRTYCSSLFGFVPIADEAIATKIAREIDMITKKYPEKLSFDREFTTLRKVFEEAYCNMIENGKVYWRS